MVLKASTSNNYCHCNTGISLKVHLRLDTIFLYLTHLFLFHLHDYTTKLSDTQILCIIWQFKSEP